MADSTCLTEKKVAGQDYSDSSRRSSIRKDSRDDEVVCDVKHDSDDDLELEQVASEVAIVQHDANDFPDGGLRAWLVVFGVSILFCQNSDRRPLIVSISDDVQYVFYVWIRERLGCIPSIL